MYQMPDARQMEHRFCQIETDLQNYIDQQRKTIQSLKERITELEQGLSVPMFTTTEELAQVLKCSVSTIKRYRRAGHIKFIEFPDGIVRADLRQFNDAPSLKEVCVKDFLRRSKPSSESDSMQAAVLAAMHGN